MSTFWSDIAKGFGESIEKAVYEMADSSVYVPTAALRPALSLWLSKQPTNKAVLVPGSDCTVRLTKSEKFTTAHVYRGSALIANQTHETLDSVSSYLDEVLALTEAVGGPTAIPQDLKKSEASVEKVKYILNFAFEKLEKAEAEKSRLKEAAESIAHLDGIVQRFKQAKLNKANEPKFQTGQKAGAMAPQAPTPPMPTVKGAAPQQLNAPKQTNTFDKPPVVKPTAGPKAKASPSAPKPPQSPGMKNTVNAMGKAETAVSNKISTLVHEGKPQKQAVAMALNMKREGHLGPKGGYKKTELSKGKIRAMSLALPKVTKDEMAEAKSDVGEKIFEEASPGEFSFNPTGAQSVMNKASVEIRKSEDGTYSIWADGQEWDQENIFLLSAFVKLNKSLSKRRT